MQSATCGGSPTWARRASGSPPGSPDENRPAASGAIPPSWRLGRAARGGQAKHPVPARVLAAGDPRRPAIGRAVFGTLLAAAVSRPSTGPVKQITPLYDHAPWLNDPFDTAVSFAMFFVPFIAACCLARVSLCRRELRRRSRGCATCCAAAASCSPPRR